MSRSDTPWAGEVTKTTTRSGTGGASKDTTYAYDQAGNDYRSGVVKQLGPPDSNQNLSTVGYVGALQFGSTTPLSLP